MDISSQGEGRIKKRSSSFAINGTWGRAAKKKAAIQTAAEAHKTLTKGLQNWQKKSQKLLGCSIVRHTQFPMKSICTYFIATLYA
jgi:hypothetical protein